MIIKDIIIVLILAVILGSALAYIIKAKKRGVKCIGCPHANECHLKENGSCKGK